MCSALSEQDLSLQPIITDRMLIVLIAKQLNFI